MLHRANNRNWQKKWRSLTPSNISRNDVKQIKKWCQHLQTSMPKTSQNRPKSRLGRLLGASRTGVGNELEKGNLGIIELGGFGTPKIDSRSTPEGFKKPSKFHLFFHIVSTRFSWPLGFQHGSQNPSESIKNRRRYRNLSWSPLNIRFSSNFCAKIGAA